MNTSLFDTLTNTWGDQDTWGTRPRPRQFAISAVKQPGNENPLIGLRYLTDFKYEEETGIGQLRDAITGGDQWSFHMSPDAADHIATFQNVNGLVLATKPVVHKTPRWGDELQQWGNTAEYYTRHFQQGSMDRDLRLKLPRTTVPELRKLAKERGISPLPRRRAELLEAITASSQAEAKLAWPGWFQDGRSLVLRADHGPVADALKHLVAAADSGHLGIANGSEAFGSGLFLYDYRDESPALQEERERYRQWYTERMDELEPVAQDLKENYLKFYFLGNPTEFEGGVVKYWLNSNTTPLAHNGRQIYGWFTLGQLQDRSFVDLFNDGH